MPGEEGVGTRRTSTSLSNSEDLVRFSDLIVSLVICDHLGHSGMFENYINCIIRFLRQRPWRPSWIFDRNDFSYFFFIYKSF